MNIPAAQFPALKAREVLRLLQRVGYQIERQKGSHRKLAAPDRLPIGFGFLDRADVPPRALRHMLSERARLTDQEIADLPWK